MKFTWTGPFFDHPLFIEAWADALKGAADDHLLFCAHAIPLKKVVILRRSRRIPEDHGILHYVQNDNPYHNQVEYTAEAIRQSLGSKNPMSIAYQSAGKIGKWSSPSIGKELHRLASNGVSDCIIIPISFLFDNVETLFDIDRVAIPAAKRAGMRDVRRATPPGNSEKITNMLINITKGTIDH